VPLSRRALLRAALVATPALLAACDTASLLDRAARLYPTPAPAAPRPLRVAHPKLDYYHLLKTRLQNASRRLPPALDAALELVAVNLSVGLPEEQSLDLPPPMPLVPKVYAQRLGADSAFRSDLVMVDPFTIGQLARQNVLHDLGPLLAREGWFDRADYLGGVLEAGTNAGKLLALPIEVATEVLWRNGPALRIRGVEPPPVEGWSWDQFVVAARRLTNPEGRPSWGASLTPALPSLFSLAWQQGAAVTSPDGTKLDLGEPGTLRAAEFLADLVHTQRVATLPDAPLPPETAHPITRAYLLQQGFGGRGFANAAMVGGLVGGPFWSRPGDGQLGTLPSDGQHANLGVAVLMLGIPRHAPDTAFSVRALRALISAASETLLAPTRSAANNLRPEEIGLTQPEGDALKASLASARYLPGGLPLDVLPVVQREFVVPVLAGKKAAAAAARDARLPIEQALRQAST
jgi:hypothetical protein